MPAQGRKNVHGKAGVRFKAGYTKSKHENTLRNLVTTLVLNDHTGATESADVATATLTTDNLTLNYKAVLMKPGKYFEATVNAKNFGTIDAELNAITFSGMRAFQGMCADGTLFKGKKLVGMKPNKLFAGAVYFSLMISF